MGAFHLLALEDNEEYQKVLRSMLSKYPGRSRLDVDIISGVTTFEALVASDDRIDIFVTDIDLGEGNPSGIDLVRRHFPAGSPTQVIYISGHVEFCTSVYQTEHTYFLLKPINQSDFDAALDKALSNLQDSRQLPVAIQHNGTVTMVDPAEVEFVESERRKVRLHSVRGECIETYATLGQMLDMLPECFVQCHKSYLVNMACIVELRPSSVLLRSGREVPVSQRQRTSVRDSFPDLSVPHGWGQGIVREVARRHGGTFESGQVDGVYRARVILKQDRAAQDGGDGGWSR